MLHAAIYLKYEKFAITVEKVGALSGKGSYAAVIEHSIKYFKLCTFSALSSVIPT